MWNFRWWGRIHGWRPPCKHGHWNCASNSPFATGLPLLLPDKFPGSGGTTASWLGTWNNFPLQIDSVSSNSLESFIQFTLSCKSCICEVSSCVVTWLSLNLCTENSSTGISWTLLNSSISWVFLIQDFEVLSLSEPLLVIGLALFEILHTHNLHHPIPTAENELVVEVHECKCYENPLYILASWFRILASASMCSLWLKDRFRRSFRIRESKQRFIVSQNLLMFWGKILSAGKYFRTRPAFAWKQRTGSPRTYRIVRWTGHQVFSHRVTNLWSFRICFSVQWRCQQSTNLVIVQVRVRTRCRDALRGIVGRSHARSMEEQWFDT